MKKLLFILAIILASCTSDDEALRTANVNYKLHINCEEPLDYIKVDIVDGNTIVDTYSVDNQPGMVIDITQGDSFIITVEEESDFSYDYKLTRPDNTVKLSDSKFCIDYCVVQESYE